MLLVHNVPELVTEVGVEINIAKTQLMRNLVTTSHYKEKTQQVIFDHFLQILNTKFESVERTRSVTCQKEFV